MSESKHTPGPWVAWSEEGENSKGRSRHSVCRHVGELDSGDHTCVAECLGDDGEEAYANARLIAAAPDLASAGTALCDEFDQVFEGFYADEIPGDLERLISNLRAAIAKAGAE